MRHTSLGVIRGIEALIEGRLDLVLGLASQAPAPVSAELIRREPLRAAMSTSHRLAEQDTVAVAQLGDHELLLPSDESGGDWNQFISVACAQAGVTVKASSSTVHGATVTAELLRETDVLLPTLTWADAPVGVAFRPLVEPELSFPWSLMTTAVSARHPQVAAFLESARGIAHEQNWLCKSDGGELSEDWPAQSGRPRVTRTAGLAVWRLQRAADRRLASRRRTEQVGDSDRAHRSPWSDEPDVASRGSRIATGIFRALGQALEEVVSGIDRRQVRPQALALLVTRDARPHGAHLGDELESGLRVRDEVVEPGGIGRPALLARQPPRPRRPPRDR